MTPPRWTSPLTGSEVHEADARTVAATPPEGVASCAILDGPYGMGKALWDRVPRGGSLLDLYRDHLADVGRVCAPSASLYLWNTAEGWGELHPAILAAGWTFRSLITWDKGDGFMAGKCDVGALRTWYDLTEVCGFYQREAWAPNTCAGQEIAQATGADDRNPTPRFYQQERERAGMTKRAMAAHFPSITGGLTGCVANWEGGLNYPTWEVWQTSAQAMHAARPLPEGERPYLVHPSIWPRGDLRATYDHLRSEYDHLRATYDHLRAEYEASRPPFTAPMGLGNVWRAPTVAGPERLRAPDGSTLHPCQKPLAFAERMLRASTRPGDVVWVPFGGTLRELVAAEHMARRDPAEARRVIACELNADGQDYIGPALAQAEGRSLLDVPATQGRLF